MTSLPSNFPRRIRIRGGEFGASARAMHRKAALENVSKATIERKLMSTKTTFKRVALVAVAALGFGLLSVVPSSATSQADTLTLSSAATTVTVGTAATTTLTQAFTGLGGDTMTVTASVSSAPTGNSAVPALTVNQASNTNASTAVTGGGLIGTTADTASATVYNSASGVYTVTLPTTAIAGTYVIKFTAAVVTPNTGTVNAAVATWTVTVGAATAATADTTSTAYIAAGGVTAPTSTTDALAVNVPMAVGTQAAAILVTPKLASASASVTLTATITGPGLIGLGTQTVGATGRSLTSGTAVSTDYVTVWPDGTAGVATITISSGSTVLGTKTVTFYGAIATVTTTVVNSVITVGSAGANVGAITAVAKDSGGNVVPVGTLYATSDTAGFISNSYSSAAIGGTTAGVATFTLTGVAEGTAKITVGTGSSSTATGAFNATPVAVRVGGAPASVKVTFDAASYTVGQAATVTVTILGPLGNPVANGTYTNIFSTTSPAAGLVSNYALGGAALPASGTITTSGSTGTQTFAVTMPTYASSVKLSATGGTALATANQVALTSATVDVTDANATAAIDAANAATDAANYAADAADAATTAAQEATAAAQAAQDSADAATAAVVALGLRVDTLMASVRAQLTSLSNLLVRLIKKAHA